MHYIVSCSVLNCKIIYQTESFDMYYFMTGERKASISSEGVGHEMYQKCNVRE